MRRSNRLAGSRTHFLPLLLMGLMLVALALTACSLGEDTDASSTDEVSTTLPDTDTTASTAQVTPTTAAPAGTTTVKAYFSLNEEMLPVSRTVPKTLATGRAAMEALLAGPTALEADVGLSTAVPAGTTLLGLTIDGGVATVDLSSEFESGGGSLSMFTRLAQVVFTLTQFPTVDSVLLQIDGTTVEIFGGEGIELDGPKSRADYEDMSPAILVESPTLGQKVKSPVRISGTANVFEATFRINIVDWDGLIIADDIVMATSGSGTRGTFDVTIPFDVDMEGLGALIVFSDSPMDGSQINVVEIPLRLAE